MHHHKGKVSYLDSPERRNALPPEEFLNMIPLKASDHILDFGAGTGYFSIPAAKITAGTVYALDTDSSMLDIIRSKAAQEKLPNILPTDTFPPGQEAVDLVLASLVLHEIDPLAPVLNLIQKTLKTDGYLVCMELEPNSPSTHKAPRITSTQMEQAIVSAGMRITQKFHPLEKLYVIIAQK